MANGRKVLLIHEESAICCSFRRAAEKHGFELALATTAAEGVRCAAACGPDVVLLDLALPDGSGLDAFRQIHAGRPRRPVVIVTDPSGAEVALAATREGAFDYVVKPTDLDRLGPLLQRAWEAVRLMRAPSLLPDSEEDRLVGRSPAMQQVCEAVARMAVQDGPVLIQGERGTGKGLVARALYQRSRRAGRPLFTVNCAVLSEAALEAELFGRARGPFTGPLRRCAGKLEQARGGTLFLDEVGELPPAAQGRLLGALRDGHFERPDGTETVRTDARLLMAATRDLDIQLARGDFRADLYALLKETCIRVPPLRERREDIPELAHHFLFTDGARQGRPVHGFTQEALACLHSHPWPGNVAELRAVVAQAVRATRGPLVLPEALPEALSRDLPACGGAAPTDGGQSLQGLIRSQLRPEEVDLYARVTRVLDRVILAEVLRLTGGNQKRSSQILGIDRKTLRKKLQTFGLLPAPAATA